MKQDQAPQPRRRWRFQFSLRTLMIAIIIYSTVWLVTAKLGSKFALRIEAQDYSSSGCQICEGEGDGRLVVLWPDGSVKRRGSAWSPAPFILISHWDAPTLIENWIKYRDTNVWCFGYRKTIGVGKDKFIPEFDEENIGFSLSVTSP